MKQEHFQIRDPLHGSIFISAKERAVIDSPAFQRLRNIKQLGFADFAFPCASHSRYVHSLGAMHIATQMFERAVDKEGIDIKDWLMMRQSVRLAALLHDIGHPPLSHTTEMLMPKVKKLFRQNDCDAQATHEHFTQKIILDSSFTHVLENNFNDMGISPKMISTLLSSEDKNNIFTIKGVSYLPLLRQIISSEIDADRMDYLLRDSFFCGVNYGKFDQQWLINNLMTVQIDNNIYLGFRARAIFAFEDFLLSRYHMFASVYLHHTPVVMEKMLGRFYEECPHEFSLTHDIEKYLTISDLDLWQCLRVSHNQWAKRITNCKPYLLVHECFITTNNSHEESERYTQIVDTLKNNGIDVITSKSKSILSKYFGQDESPLLVVGEGGKFKPLEQSSSVFIKYQKPAEIFRVFVADDKKILSNQLIQDYYNDTP